MLHYHVNMSQVLVIGANRGLGAELTKQFVADGNIVYGTTRSADGPKAADLPEDVKWLPGVDLMKADVGDTVVRLLGAVMPLDIVVRIPSPLLTGRAPIISGGTDAQVRWADHLGWSLHDRRPRGKGPELG